MELGVRSAPFVLNCPARVLDAPGSAPRTPAAARPHSQGSRRARTTRPRAKRPRPWESPESRSAAGPAPRSSLHPVRTDRQWKADDTREKNRRKSDWPRHRKEQHEVNADERQHREGGGSPEGSACPHAPEEIGSEQHFLGNAPLREQARKQRNPPGIQADADGACAQEQKAREQQQQCRRRGGGHARQARSAQTE